MQFGEDLKIKLRTRLALLCFVGLILGFAVWFAASLKPVLAKKGIFTVSRGEGFRDVAEKLEAEGFVRSDLAAKIFFLISGSAFHLQPGSYVLAPGDGVPRISAILRNGEKQTVKVVIPEGSSVYDIDEILAGSLIIKSGEFISWVKKQDTNLEGRLFPDTYDFFLESSPEEVAGRMMANFDLKAKPILEKDSKQVMQNLILASLLEKEVPDFKDRQIVAGILLKRVKVGMPLQVDATICYVKEMAGKQSCYPISGADLKADSPYNTYLNRGLPPGPIGNPGAESIEAAMSPMATPYWYYLSDPATGRTIFSETLDIHASNRVKYLKK